MSSIFYIRFYLIFFLLLVCKTSFCQQNKTEVINDKNWQKLGFGSIEYAQPIPSGNNFLALGMQAKMGFNIKAQFFVHKHIFISGTVGSSYFNVTDKSVVGNYNETNLNYKFLSLGYEIIPFKNTRMGLSLSVYGETKYKNGGIVKSIEAFQNDNGHAKSYEAYFDYLITDEFAVYFNYSYRNDKTNIITAPEIQSLFERVSFHNIGIGIKLYFGQSDIISGI